MMDDSDAVVSPLKPPFIPTDDPPFDFSITEWIDSPVYKTILPETTPESNLRAHTEKEYRSATTPTAWHRYLTLGRYVTDGFTFDSIMDEASTEPHKMHCLIWYQFKYHTDNSMELPPKLNSWALDRTQPYLLNHSVSAFTLNTKKTNWKDFSRAQSISNPWLEVKEKSKHKAKKVASSQSFASAASLLGSRAKPVTIVEESSKASDSTDTRGTKRSATRDDKSSASDAKQSVLIQENPAVPVSDGTYRVTIRWQTALDINRLSRQPQDLKDAIHDLLNDLFDDDDGRLYKWQQPGTEQSNLISNMTSNEVRQYISPSISLLPSQSMTVIPIRFGFLSNTPAKWRNQELTKKKLDDYNVTVSFSNCTSVSGNLVVAGYILLKAPMTTHRLRYLQSLRQLLPPNTPPFDILLHKRSPSDQQIPHLVVQCGNTHVHSLCESLASILTGHGSALFIPRFVFSQLTDSEAAQLFHTHDSHVKSLCSLPLAPLLSNLDLTRKEHFPDGRIVERTTREWARTIKNLEGDGLAQCDVVNGGLDQLCYLLFTPQHREAATIALEEYRRRLYPFNQREARFRESIGPPPFIQMSKSVIANLDFIKQLSSSNTVRSSSEASSDLNENSTAATPESGITDSSFTKVPRPPTSAESLRLLYSQRAAISDLRNTSSDDDSTKASTATAQSQLSDGRMSTSSAKFRELDSALKRQQKTHEKNDAKLSDRLSSIERQLHRIDQVDSKLDLVQTDFGSRLTLFEGRMTETVRSQMAASSDAIAARNLGFMETLMEEITTIFNQHLRDTEATSHTSTAIVAHDPSQVAATSHADSSSSSSTSHSSSSRSHMSAESTTNIQSPEHKRQRSKKKKSLTDSVRRKLEKDLEAVSQPSTSAHEPPSSPLAIESQTPSASSLAIASQKSHDSLDVIMDEITEIMNSDITNNFAHPDHESQYNTAGQRTQDETTNATPSPGSGASS